jgi:DNA repair protein RecO (recombination protein O)
MSGFYLNELLLKLLAREDPFPEVFEAYSEALGGLADVHRETAVLRLFEKQLLDALGFGIDYAQCLGSGERVSAGQYYHVDPARGVVASVEADRPGAVAGELLLALAAEAFDDDKPLGPVRGLLRAALDAALEGRELNSRRVARAVKVRPAMKEN